MSLRCNSRTAFLSISACAVALLPTGHCKVLVEITKINQDEWLLVRSSSIARFVACIAR